MTLYGAIRVGDGLVVVSDGLSDDVGVEADAIRGAATEQMASREPVRKLLQVGTFPLVWGWAGDAAPGQAFGVLLDDLTSADWATMTWGTLASWAGTSLLRCNREAVEQMRASAAAYGVPPSPVLPICEIVIAGVLDGSADVLKVDRMGLADQMGERQQRFVGTVPIQANTAWLVLKRLIEPADAYTLETFRRFFEAFVECAGTLGPPVNGWEIPLEGEPVAFGEPQVRGDCA